MKNFPKVTIVLIFINIMVFLINALVLNLFNLNLNDYLSLYPFDDEKFNVIQFITSNFSHIDLDHLLYNMIVLFFAGSFLEIKLSRNLFLKIYLISEIFSSLTYCVITNVEKNKLSEVFVENNLTESDFILNNDLTINSEKSLVFKKIDKNLANEISNKYIRTKAPSLGASGSIYGLLIVFIIVFNYKKIILSSIFLFFVVISTIGTINYVEFGSQTSPIHLVGALSGLVGYLILKNINTNRKSLHQI
jgi:membrane associated rhomboid family serine protease